MSDGTWKGQIMGSREKGKLCREETKGSERVKKRLKIGRRG